MAMLNGWLFYSLLNYINLVNKSKSLIFKFIYDRYRLSQSMVFIPASIIFTKATVPSSVSQIRKVK